MKFTKLSEAEQGEFLELLKDCIDPDFYSEDDLPVLRAYRKRWEEKQSRAEATPVPEYSGGPTDGDPEPPSDWYDPWRWDRE